MKTPLNLTCAALASCLATYSSSGITIISSEQSVESHWAEWWVVLPEDAEEPGPEDYYHTAGEGLVSQPHGWARAAVELSPFELRMEASAPGDDYLEGSIRLLSAGIWPSAQATTRFTTAARQLDIDVTTFARFNYYTWEQDMRVALLDLTANTTLFDVEDLDVLGWSNTVLSFELPANPSHEYELTISGHINASDAKYAEMSLNVAISEVPELTATLPLLGLCLLGLATVRGALPWTRSARC